MMAIMTAVVGSILFLMLSVHAVSKIVGIKFNVFGWAFGLIEALFRAVLGGVGWILRQILTAIGRGLAAGFIRLFGLEQPRRGRRRRNRTRDDGE